MTCPNCNSEMMKVIYFGLPGRLCENYGCSTLSGPVELIPNWLSQFAAGEDGFCFMTYEGSYWRALWQWLKGAE